MTIDPDTKKYIDDMFIEHSIKISSLLSAICNTLEERKLLSKQDFDIIMERANQMASNAMTIGPKNFLAFAKNIKDLDELKRKLDKEGIDRSTWKDLK